MKQVDTSGLSFQRIIDGDVYYVDKTLLIKDILDTNRCGVYLFTRPRRFGKTLNLSMLDAFFNIRYRGNAWFDGLEISKHPEYECYRNAFPVIRLDLKEAKSNDYEGFMDGIRSAVFRCYQDHDYIFNDPDFAPSKQIGCINDTLIGLETSEGLLRVSIQLLSKELERYHGRKVVILIDEYDRAVSDAFGKESHRPMMDFLGEFLNATLKTNESLQMAYVTGVMQIAKESIFSDLNNIDVKNIFSVQSDERFGFTEAEVKTIIKDYGHPERFDEAKGWYDGYRFGNAEVYNPYSVMSYVSNGFLPKAYWANSGGDSVVRWLLEMADDRTIDDLGTLVNGGSINVRLQEAMTYSDVRSRAVSLYSLMTMSGYLKAVPSEDGRFDISIPNMDVGTLVDAIIEDMNPIDERIFLEFNRAILDCDADRMASLLQIILCDTSYLNLKDENAYGIMILTIMHSLNRRYDVKAEVEAGNGRTDIMFRPKSEGPVPMIFELKRVGSEDMLNRGLDEALEQIHDKRYYLGMKGRAILVGMAFCGKIPKVRIETIEV